MCVCLKNSITNDYTFSLQWHLTAKCDQKCKHCYMYGSSSYKSELENELSFEKCISIIDDFVESLNIWNKEGGLYLSGGDPLLREDFFDILDYTKNKKIFPIAVMGNSYHVNKTTARKLKDCGVFAYQISLDGLKNTHDSLRKPGSFDDAVRAFKILNDEGVKTTCMFTVSKLNMHELIDVINFSKDLGLCAFDFDRMVPTGNAKEIQEEMIDKEEYNKLLIKVNNEYKKLIDLGVNIQFGYKDNLWGLVINEIEEKSHQTIVPYGFETARGCLIGKSGLSVLSDGTVLACRRLPVVVGKLPDQKIKEVFENSIILNKLRDFEKVEKCGSCNKLSECGGCRAVAYGASNDNYLSPDPQCWYK